MQSITNPNIDLLVSVSRILVCVIFKNLLDYDEIFSEVNPKKYIAKKCFIYKKEKTHNQKEFDDAQMKFPNYVAEVIRLNNGVQIRFFTNIFELRKELGLEDTQKNKDDDCSELEGYPLGDTNSEWTLIWLSDHLSWLFDDIDYDFNHENQTIDLFVTRKKIEKSGYIR